MVLMHEINAFELRIERNSQRMIPAVLSATKEERVPFRPFSLLLRQRLITARIVHGKFSFNGGNIFKLEHFPWLLRDEYHREDTVHSSIVISVPTRASLAVETIGILFLWLAHLNDKAMFVNRCLPYGTHQNTPCSDVDDKNHPLHSFES